MANPNDPTEYRRGVIAAQTRAAELAAKGNAADAARRAASVPGYTPDAQLQRAMRRPAMPIPPSMQGATSKLPGTDLVPAGPRTVNPDPRGRAPRMVGGAANPVPPAAADGPLPNYRTGAGPGQPQFKQTPAPTQPSYRGAAGASAAGGGANQAGTGVLRRFAGSTARTVGRAAPYAAPIMSAINSATDEEGKKQYYAENADTLAGNEPARYLTNYGNDLTFGAATDVGKVLANGGRGTTVEGRAAQAALPGLSIIPGMSLGLGAGGDIYSRNWGSTKPAETPTSESDSRRRAGAPRGGKPYSQTMSERSYGTWNGREISRREGDALAGMLNTVPAESFGQGASRRGDAPMGYAGQGLRTSRRPTVDDRYQLQRDLSTMGRGSPTIRAALMQRYNDQFNNAERGQNDMAVTDLSATARGAENFADRQMAADQFDREFEMKSLESGARINVLDEMRKDAAARREDDLYGLRRRGERDKTDESRLDRLTEIYGGGEEGRKRAQMEIWAGRDATGELPDTEAAAVGAQLTEAGAFDIFSDPERRTAIDFANPWESAFQSQVDVPDGVDPASIRTRPVENIFGTDASTLNSIWERLPLLGGSRPLPEYEAYIPTTDPGTEIRANIKDAAELREFEKKRDAAARAAAARRKQAGT